MDKIDKILGKKIAGVKVLYLALVFVLILGWYAWRSIRTEDIDSATGSEESGDAPDVTGDGYSEGAVYPRLESGTVYTATPPPDVDGDTPDGDEVMSNDQWLRQGVNFLVSSGRATPAVAQTALQKALSGADLSYAQGALYDDVVREIGLPPTPIQIGDVAGKPKPKPDPKPGPKPTPKKRTPGRLALNLVKTYRNGADFSWKINEEAGTDGIQIQTSWVRDFSKIGHDYHDSQSPTRPRNQKPGTQYYARGRAYDTQNGTRVYGEWSNVVAYRTKG